MEMLWINVAQPLVNPPGDGSIRIRGSLIHLLPLLLILSALTVWLRIVFPSAGLAAAGEPALKFQTVESQAVDDILFKPGLGLYLAGGSRLGYQPPPDARALSLCNIVYFRPDWNDLESAGPASGIESTVDPQTFHSGTSSLRLTGDQRGAWNYAARSLAMPVLPGSKYRLSCWLRMDRLEPAQVVPYLKIGLTGADGRWLTNFQTNLYDMAATGTWQRLEGIVETPLETAGGHLALERGSKEARAVYGRLKNGWYGLRSLLRTLVAMALLRIKRPEQLKHHGPAELGRVLGMPRAAEVKTVRRKLFEISLLGKAAQWHRELARRRVEQQPMALASLYVDGHLRAASAERDVAEQAAASAARESAVEMPGGGLLLFAVPLPCAGGGGIPTLGRDRSPAGGAPSDAAQDSVAGSLRPRPGAIGLRAEAVHRHGQAKCLRDRNPPRRDARRDVQQRGHGGSGRDPGAAQLPG
jgi:hypothetical protein